MEKKLLYKPNYFPSGKSRHYNLIHFKGEHFKLYHITVTTDGHNLGHTFENLPKLGDTILLGSYEMDIYSVIKVGDVWVLSCPNYIIYLEETDAIR